MAARECPGEGQLFKKKGKDQGLGTEKQNKAGANIGERVSLGGLTKWDCTARLLSVCLQAVEGA